MKKTLSILLSMATINGFCNQMDISTDKLIEYCRRYQVYEMRSKDTNLKLNKKIIEQLDMSCANIIINNIKGALHEYNNQSTISSRKSLEDLIKIGYSTEVVRGCILQKKYNTKNPEIIKIIGKDHSDLTISEEKEWDHWISNVIDYCTNENINNYMVLINYVQYGKSSNKMLQEMNESY